MITLTEHIAKKKRAIASKMAERGTHVGTISAIRSTCDTENRDPSEDEARQVTEARAAASAIATELAEPLAEIASLEEELRRDEAADAVTRQVVPGAESPSNRQQLEVREGNENRTYREDTDRHGAGFLNDLSRQFMFNDGQAALRLSTHMNEERAVRGDQIDRAAGTGAYAGLVVPQYLTDLYAPLARAGRPFADACRHHDLPEQGMVAYIGRVTTGTTVANQANEFDTVSETDIDDTLLTVNIKTAAGSQTISRQALERGIGVEDTTMQDLFGAYATNLDSTLINEATFGLSAVANSIAYTDGTPTAPELYPKLLQAPSNVEAALLNQAQDTDLVAVMHSRRWYWLQSQLTSTWPMFGSQGIATQNGGFDYGKKYGDGFRGILPSGVAVVVDNNIAINKGAGTNEDEIYFGAQSELHLWEDPSAPMLIRAEQSQVKKLAVDFVAYGYFANTFVRRPHAQKIAGTGLVTPTF